jgi:hypothetical protein
MFASMFVLSRLNLANSSCSSRLLIVTCVSFTEHISTVAAIETVCRVIRLLQLHAPPPVPSRRPFLSATRRDSNPSGPSHAPHALIQSYAYVSTINLEFFRSTSRNAAIYAFHHVFCELELEIPGTVGMRIHVCPTTGDRVRFTSFREVECCGAMWSMNMETCQMA